MICCLNPNCHQPQNPDDAQVCRSCGTELTPLLRGRYRVVHPIGQGGFGRTYLAVDEDRLKAKCVIKQFSPQFQGTSSLNKAIQLFEQEAVRLHELGEHPQIPTLLAYFEHSSRLYLVQQFVEGPNLVQELQRQGAFSEQRIRDLLYDLLPVLKFIHERQVIHRDITPGNIIRRASDGRLVLIDFGVSKLLTGTSMGQVGTRIGTEGYAPIEQMRSGRAYPASDLYSLGATSIHLFTQVKPDDLYDPLSGSWLWREHLAQKGRTVSDRLGYILDKMLKDMVNERYQSADAIFKDLTARSARSTAGTRDNSTPQPNSAPPNSAPSTAQPPVSQFPSQPPLPPPTSAQPQAAQTRSEQPTTTPQPISQPNFSRPPAFSQPFGSQPVSQFQGQWKCVRTIAGHPSWVNCVAISPNGQTVASGSLDDKVKLWNIQDGNLLQTLAGHSRPVNCIAFHPDGNRLISGSDDDTIKIWQVETGRLIRTLTEHGRDVNSVAVSPDGKYLVSGSEDRSVRIWNLETGELLRTLLGTAGMVKTVAIGPAGQMMVSGGLDNKIKVWSLLNGELLRTLSGHVNSVMGLAISADAQTIASGSKDKTVRLWNVKTGELVRTLSGHSDMVHTVAIAPNCKTVLSGSSDKTIKVWHLSSGELLTTLTDHLDSVNSIAISPNGQVFASCGKDKAIKIWQLGEQLKK